jgi:hypothetical protein
LAALDQDIHCLSAAKPHLPTWAAWLNRYAAGGAVLRLFGFLLVTIMGLQGVSAQTIPISLDGEHFTKKFVGKPPGGDKLVEYVRESESFQRWTKLIGFRYQQLPRIDNDPMKLAPAMAQFVRAANPQAQTRVLVLKEKGEALIDFLTWPPDASYLEFNIFRYARSLDGNAVVSVQFAHRFTDRSAESVEKFRRLRQAWIDQAAAFDMAIAHGEVAP